MTHYRDVIERSRSQSGIDLVHCCKPRSTVTLCHNSPPSPWIAFYYSDLTEVILFVISVPYISQSAGPLRPV